MRTERKKLIDQAIESATCRVYYLRSNNDSSNTFRHQQKAKNQEALMEITIEALLLLRENEKEK